MSPSPPFRGEREGPVAQRREGEVGRSASAPASPPLPSPTSPHPSPPSRAERELDYSRSLQPGLVLDDLPEGVLVDDLVAREAVDVPTLVVQCVAAGGLV